MKKTLAILLSVCMIVAMLAGCGSSSSETTTTSGSGEATTTNGAADEAINNNDENKRSDEAVDNSVTIDSITQLDSAPANLDPTAMNNQGMNFLWEVYEMPYQLSEFGGDLVPVLVDGDQGNYKPGMDHEEGSNEYILHLKKGIIDHNGVELKGSDAAFSYETLNASGNARGWALYEKAEAAGDYDVKITFSRELNLVGELTTFFARVFFFTEESYNNSATGFVSDACGTGPYKLKEYVTGSKLVLEKNEDYWCPEDEITCQLQTANSEIINYVFASETASQVVALGTGEADVDTNLSLADAGDFQEGGQYADKYDIYTYWDNLTYCILPNCHEDAITGDVNMRLAIMYAVSVEGVTAGLAADVPGSYRECYGMGNPNFPDFSDSWASWDNYETASTEVRNEKVQEYLDAAGYNGETIEIITMSGDMETIATIVNGMLDSYGIKSNITLVDRTTQSTIKADPTAWDISIESWASSDYVVNMWDKLWKSTDDDGYIKESGQFIKDDEFLQMCLDSKTEEGHTQEAVDAIQQKIIDNAYAMGLTQKCSILIYPKYVKSIYMTDKNAVMVGACSYNEKE